MFWDNAKDSVQRQRIKNAVFLMMPLTNEQRNRHKILVGTSFFFVLFVIPLVPLLA